MSLQIRLPLDGNLENKGILRSSVITNNGATVNINGKTGKCYSFDGSDDYISISGLGGFFTGGSNLFSVSFWFYHDGNSRRGILFGNYNLASTSECFNLEITADNKIRFWWKGNPNWIPLASQFTIVTKTWYHVTYTYDGSKLCLYINGNLTDTLTVTLAKLTSSTLWYLGRDSRTGATAFQGKINEFKLWDHALSVKEIAENYRTLILHYKLSGRDILLGTCKNITWNQLINPNNFPASGTQNGLVFSSNKPEGSITFNGDCSAYTVISINHGSVPVTINHKYVFKGCPPGGVNPDNSTIGTYDYRISYNYNGTKYVSELGDGLLWTSPITGTINVYVRFAKNSKNTNVTFYPKVFDLTLMFGSGNEPDLKTFLKMFPYNYYPYDSGTIKNLSEPILDLSGYSRDVNEIVGNILPQGDSSRYKNSLKMDGATGLISKEFYTPETCTYCFWAKINNTSSKFFIDARKSNTGVLPAYMNGTTFQVYSSTGGSNNHTITIPTATWVHLAIALTGTTNKVYLNGVLLASGTIAHGMNISTPITIGMRHSKATFMTGAINDIRMYAVELTADEIKDIMTQASLDNKGDLFCYELIEDSSIKINNSGIVNSESINEETLTGKQASMLKTGTFKVNQILEK